MMRRRGQNGFLLLEVLVAVALVAVGLFVLLEGLNRCLAAARSVQNYSTAQVLLSNKSFEFRVERDQDYDDQEGRFEDYPGFSWERTLVETEIEHLYKQTITVYWDERGKHVGEMIVEYRYLPEKPS